MKKIVIHTPKGINQSMKTSAKEAVEEFLSMFPEYKDSFRIELRDDETIRGYEISQAEYDKLSGVDKKDYIKNARGKWLVPHKSMEWYMLSSRAANGAFDPGKLTELHDKRIWHEKKGEVPVCLINERMGGYYGYTGSTTDDSTGERYDSVVVSISKCRNDKEFLKTIIIHELGHVFNATHENRAHTIIQHGPHCTNNLCIMGASNYPELHRERLRRKTIGAPPGQPPFCDECIASMREYMSHMPELTRRVQAQQMPQQQQQPSQPEPVVSKPYYMPVAQRKNPSNMPPLEEWHERLQPEPHNSREWKNDLREFYKNVAARDGDTYKENIKSQNYMARIKRSDGSTLEIEANNEYNVALGRTNTTDGDITPTLKDMRDLVRYAQQKKSGMSFDKDNTPEFNARLLIACLEAGFKPYQMKNQPQVTLEFLAKIKPETRRLLQNTLNNSRQQTTPRQGGRS